MTRVLKMICLTASIMMISMIMIPGSTLAWDSDFDLVVGPGQYDKVPIPIDESDVNIRIESDIGVNVYIMKDDQYTRFESSGVPSEYEESFTYVKSKSFDYNAEGTLIQWVIVVNEDPSLTANVTVEFVVGEELTGACCGSTIIILSATLVAIVVALKFVIRR